MGLDISVYEHCEFVRAIGEDEEPPADLDYLYNIPEFAARGGGMPEGLYRTKERRDLAFKAGSYSGYNEWRRWLAELVGVVDREVWQLEDDSPETKAIPFYELINFPDNEGFLGTNVCIELAKDFKDHAEKVGELGWDARLYMQWRRAFEAAAANNGVVKFH